MFQSVFKVSDLNSITCNGSPDPPHDQVTLPIQACRIKRSRPLLIIEKDICSKKREKTPCCTYICCTDKLIYFVMHFDTCFSVLNNCILSIYKSIYISIMTLNCIISCCSWQTNSYTCVLVYCQNQISNIMISNQISKFIHYYYTFIYMVSS